MRKFIKLCLYLLALGLIWIAAEAYIHFKDGAPLQITLATACDGKGECPDPVALLEGPINARSESKTTSDLLDFIKSHPTVDTVCLVSEGGDIDTSVALGRFIHREGLNTCIADKYKIADGSLKKGYCQSSCVWVSVSGNESVLYDNSALLGFHAARVQDLFGNVKEIDSKGLLKFAELIKEVSRDTAEQNRLYGLLLWSFDQGTTTATTDCSAQQVQEHYPYFSKVKDANNGTYGDCGLR